MLKSISGRQILNERRIYKMWKVKKKSVNRRGSYII